MERILGERGDALLARVVEQRVLLAFDFDGTLAPIVRSPSAATMRPRTRQYLLELGTQYPCAVVSGRAVDDVRTRVPQVRPDLVIGNHGVGMDPASEQWTSAVISASERLEHALGNIAGIEVENKRLSIAIHYRHAIDHREARRHIERAIMRVASRMRRLAGKAVVNLLPPCGGDKGVALDRLRRRLGLDHIVFVGDDVTDEDAFALRRSQPMLAIRVGECRHSAATHFIRDQREIDALLRRLLELRAVRS